MTTNKYQIVHQARQLFLIVLIGTSCFIALLPFFWSFSTSLRLPAESYRMPPDFFPTDFHWQHYLSVFEKFPFARFVINSLIVSFSVMFLSLFVTTLAAFSLARINFRGKNAIFTIFMSGMMIPYYATMLSVYIIMSKLHLVGSLWALIIPAAINPLHIFLVRQFMMTIPKSYEEAAEIDGYGRFGIYLKIMVPMSKPVMMLAALQAFIASWNNFVGPLIYLSDWNKMTLPVGIRMLSGYMGSGSMSVILAGITMSLIMPILLFAFGQRYLIEGIALTGVKS
ncbi:MAG: carbohydrate ABC transporter permease [Treponema sp.]|jgi:multiple sugar transport system permease protein|nr:carbohydrate ABC transporter permease [Treponema sp.]